MKTLRNVLRGKRRHSNQDGDILKSISKNRISKIFPRFPTESLDFTLQTENTPPRGCIYVFQKRKTHASNVGVPSFSVSPKPIARHEIPHNSRIRLKKRKTPYSLYFCPRGRKLGRSYHQQFFSNGDWKGRAG